MADLESLIPVASTVEFLEQHTNESSDCLVPGLVYLAGGGEGGGGSCGGPGEPGTESCIGESGNGT